VKFSNHVHVDESTRSEEPISDASTPSLSTLEKKRKFYCATVQENQHVSQHGGQSCVEEPYWKRSRFIEQVEPVDCDGFGQNVKRETSVNAEAFYSVPQASKSVVISMVYGLHCLFQFVLTRFCQIRKTCRCSIYRKYGHHLSSREGKSTRHFLLVIKHFRLFPLFIQYHFQMA
jgi:hypothetical protein